MKNERFSGLAFLFIVPLLFVIICLIVDFTVIYKEKRKLNDNMNIIVDLYRDGNISRILSYSHEQEFSVSYVEQENGVKFTLTKKIKTKTPVGKHVFGDLYELKISKIVTNESLNHNI